MIYLDYASSAPICPQVAAIQHQTALECFANPASVHRAGGSARQILQSCRKQLAGLLKVRPEEIFFTSGGTEANNWAIALGCQLAKGNHIVASAIEHSSVLEPLKHLEGYSLTYVKPDPQGRILPEAVDAACRPDTCMICVQAVNNETGVIQDIDAISAIARRRRIPYFCDAVQSFGHVNQNWDKASLLSLSAHKLGGPRGVGCLVVRYPYHIPPLLWGGGQEYGRRSGTENLPGIAGFVLAAQLSQESLDTEYGRLTDLSRNFLSDLRNRIPGLEVNGEDAARHPGILNLRFPGISAEEMVLRLDGQGICASPGAACAARDPSPSHVLTAMGLSEKQASESVRFSLGRLTTEAELKQTAAVVCAIMDRGARKHAT